MTFCLPGLPTEYQYCRAILRATSTATEPESLKKTRSREAGVREVSSWASFTAGGWVRPPNITWDMVSSCACTARFMAGWL